VQVTKKPEAPSVEWACTTLKGGIWHFIQGKKYAMIVNTLHGTTVISVLTGLIFARVICMNIQTLWMAFAKTFHKQ